MMGPYDRISFGKREKMYGVVTVNNGDKKTPNVHSYKKYTFGGTPLTQRAHYYRDGRIASDVSYPGGLAGIPSDLVYLSNDSSILPYEAGRLSDSCMEKAFEKLRGQSQVFVDLAEGGQTLKMVKSAFRLRSTMISFVKQALRGRKQTVTELSSKWLEYRYGWLPLMGSIYDAADNLYRQIIVNDIVISTRSGFRTTRDLNYFSSTTGQHKVWYEHLDVSQRMQLVLMFRPPSMPTQVASNWTSLNPLLIAWELVPLSFVADWFVNVGSQLAAWENYVLYSQHYKSGYRSETIKEVRNSYWRMDSPRSAPVPEYYSDGTLKVQSYGYNQFCGGVSRFVSMNRVLNIPLPRPAGVRVKFNLSAKQVADTAALTSKWWRRLL